MATCSEVASCLSEGATVCILTSGKCPPCVYALSGGDFSCYSRDTSDECPFSGAYAECDKATSSSTSTSSKTNSDQSSGDTTSDTPAPTAKTKAPAKTTATPTATTATPTTSTTETSSSTRDSATSNETPSNETPSTDATLTPSTTAPASSTNENPPTQTASSASNASTDSGTEQALTSSSTSTTGSPAVVNLALIGGAVVLAVVVIAFVTRRVVRKKKMNHSQERTIASQNSAWSDRTLGTGVASGGNLYSTYSYKDETGKGNGITMLSDSQASSTYGPGYDQSMHSGSSPRSTADFSNYGGESKYATESQYYNDYSVSTGPQLLAAGAVAENQHPFANSTVPSSASGNNNFVDATSMANRESSFGSVRQHPLTVSQLMDSSVQEDEDQAYADRRRPAPEQYQEPRAFNIPSAVSQTTRTPQIFATSTASSMRSDYDIVDPITMQEVEERNTEMLAEENRYPKFSFESEAASDVYEGSSSEEESDDEHLRHGEHTI